MKHTNTIIVGQGLAGTLTAFLLYRKNIPFVVMDTIRTNSASMVAAGMFTPINGQRKTLHALTMQQIPFALDIYRQLENLLQVKLVYLENVYQLFNSPGERDELEHKSATPGFADLMKIATALLPGIQQENGAVEISHSGWIDCALLINSFRNWLQQQDIFVQESFGHDKLVIDKSTLQYKDWQSERIIFCEGYTKSKNLLFEENIIPCRGDVITIGCETLPASYIFKKNKCYLVATSPNRFKAGATYAWNNDDATPTEAGRNEIQSQLDQLITGEYIVVDHQAGIRPTTVNREVIAKQHPINSNLFMLNGLGTKGVIQGPWFAHLLVEKHFNNC